MTQTMPNTSDRRDYNDAVILWPAKSHRLIVGNIERLAEAIAKCSPDRQRHYLAQLIYALEHYGVAEGILSILKGGQHDTDHGWPSD